MNLSKLQLRNCPGSLDLLRTLVDNDQRVKLKSFEVTVGYECLQDFHDNHDIEGTTTASFLDSFKGPEDLFLLLSTAAEWHLLLNSIANH